METTYLTDTQIMRKVIARTKQWLKAKELHQVQVQFIRGTYYFTNAGNYLLTAQDILQHATGLKFLALSDNAAKIDKTQF